MRNPMPALGLGSSASSTRTSAAASPSPSPSSSPPPPPSSTDHLDHIVRLLLPLHERAVAAARLAPAGHIPSSASSTTTASDSIAPASRSLLPPSLRHNNSTTSTATFSDDDLVWFHNDDADGTQDVPCGCADDDCRARLPNRVHDHLDDDHHDLGDEGVDDARDRLRWIRRRMLRRALRRRAMRQRARPSMAEALAVSAAIPEMHATASTSAAVAEVDAQSQNLWSWLESSDDWFPALDATPQDDDFVLISKESGDSSSDEGNECEGMEDFVHRHLRSGLHDIAEDLADVHDSYNDNITHPPLSTRSTHPRKRFSMTSTLSAATSHDEDHHHHAPTSSWSPHQLRRTPSAVSVQSTTLHNLNLQQKPVASASSSSSSPSSSASPRLVQTQHTRTSSGSFSSSSSTLCTQATPSQPYDGAYDDVDAPVPSIKTLLQHPVPVSLQVLLLAITVLLIVPEASSSFI